MMNWVNDPSSFVVGLSLGLAFETIIRMAVRRFRMAIRTFRQAKEIDHGDNGPAVA